MHLKKSFLLPPLAIALLSSCGVDNLGGKSAQKNISDAAAYLASASYHVDSTSTFSFDTSQIPSANLAPYVVSSLRKATIEAHLDVKDTKDISANEVVTSGNISVPVWVILAAGKSYISSDGTGWTTGTPPFLQVWPQATDPTQQLAEATTLLSNLAPKFKDLGSEEKNGASTHHLQAAVDLALIASVLATNPSTQMTSEQVNQSILAPSGTIDIWIDQVSGHPLDFAATVAFKTPIGGTLARLALGPPAEPLSGITGTVPVTITNTMALYGWGNPITVVAPSLSATSQPPSFSEFYR